MVKQEAVMQDFSMQGDNSRAGTFMFGVLLGAAVGAAVSLLVTPKTGPEMRRQVMDSTDGLRRKASAAYAGATSALNDVIARGRDAIDAGRQTFESSRPGNGSAI
jgi:gas vesicle protein